MSDSSPIFEVVGDGEISDDAVEALARLLLSLVDQDAPQSGDQEEEAQSA